MNKEELLLQNRIIDLSRTAHHQGIVTFTGFLNLNERQILLATPRAQLHTTYRLSGGYPESERVIAAFLPDERDLDAPNYPIRPLLVRPTHKKFADDLGHRDFLGAILSLGIERRMVGDILVTDREAVVFAEASIAPYIAENLSSVRRTAVTVGAVNPADFHYTPKYLVKKGSVASVRLDALIALAFGLPRNRAVTVIEDGQTFVNGKRISSNGYKLVDNDIISVRGLGRFLYQGVSGTSRKERLFVEVWVMV